jgi:hypothetical protein
VHLGLAALSGPQPFRHNFGDFIDFQFQKTENEAQGTGRVLNVRQSVRGRKTMGEAQPTLLLICPDRRSRVPHISLVFREMWDTTGLS